MLKRRKIESDMNGNGEILFLAYYFPPMGMGGVQRAVKLAKYLSRSGWGITVLTVKDVLYYAHDSSLLEDLDDRIDIVRSGSLDPIRLAGKYGIKKKEIPVKREPGKSNILPDNKLLWLPFAYLKAVRLIKKKKIKAIISTAPPFSSHILAMLLGQKFTLPWIADFRDSWTISDFDIDGVRPSGLNNFLERRIIETANSVTVVSNTHLEGLISRYPGTDKKFELIYNGFDHEDFPDDLKHEDTFNLTYCGTSADVIDPSVFLPYLEKAIDMRPEIAGSLKINIVGKILSDNIREKFENFKYPGCIELKGYVNHSNAVKELLKSNVLLFPVTGNAKGGVLTSKVFEYLFIDKPIIAHIPEGEIKQILEKYNKITYLINEGEGGRFIEDFFFQYTDWEKKTLSRKDYIQKPSISKKDTLEIFSRRSQAERFSELLDRIISRKKEN